MPDATLQTADSAALVELCQSCDGIVEMSFDLLRAAGSIGQESRAAACEAFVIALEIDCELCSRWGDSRLGIEVAW